MNDIWTYYPGIIAASPSPVVLEIGAARGEDTVKLMAPVLESGKPYRYLAFEPEPNNIPFLRALPVAAQIDIIQAAVGDHSGSADFRGTGDWPYSGSLKEPRQHETMWPDVKFMPPTKVVVVTLDGVTLAHRIDRVDFIWCDVQGAEDLVIDGGQKTLARTRYFYTEHLEVEAYAGQIPLAEIHRRLPGNWELVEDFGMDALFKNLDLPAL